MRGIRDFIVYTDVVFNDTFKTESGLELHGDKRFLQKRLSQREVTITAIPFDYEGEDITGWKAFIDPTIYFQNIYDHGKGANNEIAGHDGYFKVQPNMIIAIRKDENSEWEGFDENLVVSKIADNNEEVKVGSIITEIAKPKSVAKECVVFITNDSLRVQGVDKGDRLRYNDYYGVDVYMDGVGYLWVRTKDCEAKLG